MRLNVKDAIFQKKKKFNKAFPLQLTHLFRIRNAQCATEPPEDAVTAHGNPQLVRDDLGPVNGPHPYPQCASDPPEDAVTAHGNPQQIRDDLEPVKVVSEGHPEAESSDSDSLSFCGASNFGSPRRTPAGPIKSTDTCVAS